MERAYEWIPQVHGTSNASNFLMPSWCPELKTPSTCITGSAFAWARISGIEPARITYAWLPAYQASPTSLVSCGTDKGGGVVAVKERREVGSFFTFQPRASYHGEFWPFTGTRSW